LEQYYGVLRDEIHNSATYPELFLPVVMFSFREIVELRDIEIKGM